jgi:hypothetical protein
LKAVKTIRKYMRVDRSGIAFLRFVLEASDGVATMTTLDPDRGMVVLNIAPGCEAEVEGILDGLEERIAMERAQAGR